MMNESPAASMNTYVCDNCGKEWESDQLDYLPFSTIKCCPDCTDTRLEAKPKGVLIG